MKRVYVNLIGLTLGLVGATLAIGLLLIFSPVIFCYTVQRIILIVRSFVEYRNSSHLTNKEVQENLAKILGHDEDNE